MAISASTERLVRELWEIGARHGRPPTPTPEVDPWEESDPLDPRHDVVIVEIPGSPTVTVRLYQGIDDTVSLDETMDLEVPRHDTAEVVEAVLARRCRLRIGTGNRLTRLLGLFLHNPLGAVLVVPVGSGLRARTYEAGAAFAPGQGSWMAGLPIE